MAAAKKATEALAIQAIERRGALLVYPLNNRTEPASIWSELWPRTKMRWEWSDDGDDRVVQLWHLREKLSRSRRVVYAKWFQGRATFFSVEVFTHLLSFLGGTSKLELSHEGRLVLEALEADSPLSTKQLKAACDLQGRLLEPTYNRALKPLWNRLWIVGFGEFDDSSFPSLGVGATKTLFEELWENATRISPAQAEEFLKSKLGEKNQFFKFATKLRAPNNGAPLRKREPGTLR